MLRRKMAALLVVCAVAGSGCSSGQPSDNLMTTDSPVAATAARSPAPTAPPAGAVATAGAVSALAVDARSRQLAVAVDDPPAVLLYSLAAETLGTPRTVPLPAPADTLTVDGAAVVASVGETGELMRITLPDGEVTTQATIRGEAVSTARFGDRTLVAVRDRKAVAVLGGDRVQRMITGDLMSADQVLSTGKGAVVIDRLRNAVFELDVRAGDITNGLRAGQGATNAVVDRFGRVLVADTRGGALLAFSLDPLLMRQNYPVPGAPYAIAYDPRRDLAWVTLTGTNEVVGYDVAGEQPKEEYRFATVEQPNTVAVDQNSGRVVVASATGKGIQVITT